MWTLRASAGPFRRAVPGYGLVADVTGAGVWPGVSGGEGFDHEHHPEALEAEVSLPTATTLGSLSRRDTGNTAPNTVSDDDENGWASFRDTSLDTYEALELLTLGERWSSGRRTTAS